MGVGVTEPGVTLQRPPAAEKGVKPAAGGLLFDWCMMLLNTLLLGGLYLDGWAHNHGKVDTS